MVEVGGAALATRRGCGRGLAVQWGGACPASHRLRRAQLFVTEMAEGELDIDSLISRLLEGKFATASRLHRPGQSAAVHFGASSGEKVRSPCSCAPADPGVRVSRTTAFSLSP